MKFKFAATYLVISLETTPVVVGVESPGSTVGGLETPGNRIKMWNRKVTQVKRVEQEGHTGEKAEQEGHTGENVEQKERTDRCEGGLRLFASILIDAIPLSDWFPVVPVEDGPGQSAASLAGRNI